MRLFFGLFSLYFTWGFLFLCVAMSCASFLAASFVGGAAASLRGSIREPEVAMNFFGGEPVTTTTTPPPMAIEADQNLVLGATGLFVVSVVANSGGFFNP